MRSNALARTLVSAAAVVGLAAGGLATAGTSFAAPAQPAAAQTVTIKAVNNLGLNTTEGKSVQCYVRDASPVGKFDPGTILNGQPVVYDLHAEHYWEHGVSIQWLWRKVGQFTVGMNNIFNEKPPTVSDNQTGIPRLGNFFGNGPYDYYGRSVFVNVTRSF